ncbi:MAG: hypothetical protein JKY23_00350 [Nitrospinaceae bacterium]|nr:hypothetical protein [Nitrospinaceae bacterium]
MQVHEVLEDTRQVKGGRCSVERLVFLLAIDVRDDPSTAGVMAGVISDIFEVGHVVVEDDTVEVVGVGVGVWFMVSDVYKTSKRGVVDGTEGLAALSSDVSGGKGGHVVTGVQAGGALTETGEDGGVRVGVTSS